MIQPFFSVIVPAHNAAARIRRGLDSIRWQTFTDWELIVVCDDCQDN
ncbi:MAG: glycosyltransferase family 2 protein, partial [Aeriscardovia sp.]|nr:glycosyltransferase family 2 protein [Aeriscardovia sp.]